MPHRYRRLFPLFFIMTAAGAGAEPSSELARWVGTATAEDAMACLRRDLVASVGRGSPVQPSVAISWPSAPTGIFVSLLRDGTVAGCMGSFEAPAGDLYAAALRTAWRATREDIRSRPLRVEDLDSVEIVVTFVGRPTPVADPEDLSPWNEGLLAVQGERSAVVVPGEAKTTRYAVHLALRNSGIDPEGMIECFRFGAVTWREDSAPRPPSRGGKGEPDRRKALQDCGGGEARP